MAHKSHTRKRSIRSMKPRSAMRMATMKQNGFRILSHKHYPLSKRVSMKNVKYALRNILPKKVNEMNTSAVREVRQSLARVAKNTYRLAKAEEELRRKQEKEEKQRKRNEARVLREARAAQAASIRNMENALSKMHF